MDVIGNLKEPSKVTEKVTYRSEGHISLPNGETMKRTVVRTEHFVVKTEPPIEEAEQEPAVPLRHYISEGVWRVGVVCIASLTLLPAASPVALLLLPLVVLFFIMLFAVMWTVLTIVPISWYCVMVAVLLLSFASEMSKGKKETK